LNLPILSKPPIPNSFFTLTMARRPKTGRKLGRHSTRRLKTTKAVKARFQTVGHTVAKQKATLAKLHKETHTKKTWKEAVVSGWHSASEGFDKVSKGAAVVSNIASQTKDVANALGFKSVSTVADSVLQAGNVISQVHDIVHYSDPDNKDPLPEGMTKPPADQVQDIVDATTATVSSLSQQRDAGPPDQQGGDEGPTGEKESDDDDHSTNVLADSCNFVATLGDTLSCIPGPIGEIAGIASSVASIFGFGTPVHPGSSNQDIMDKVANMSTGIANEVANMSTGIANDIQQSQDALKAQMITIGQEINKSIATQTDKLSKSFENSLTQMATKQASKQQKQFDLVNQKLDKLINIAESTADTVEANHITDFKIKMQAIHNRLDIAPIRQMIGELAPDAAHQEYGVLDFFGVIDKNTDSFAGALIQKITALTTGSGGDPGLLFEIHTKLANADMFTLEHRVQLYHDYLNTLRLCQEFFVLASSSLSVAIALFEKSYAVCAEDEQKKNPGLDKSFQHAVPGGRYAQETPSGFTKHTTVFHRTLTSLQQMLGMIRKQKQNVILDIFTQHSSDPLDLTRWFWTDLVLCSPEKIADVWDLLSHIFSESELDDLFIKLAHTSKDQLQDYQTALTDFDKFFCDRHDGSDDEMLELYRKITSIVTAVTKRCTQFRIHSCDDTKKDDTKKELFDGGVTITNLEFAALTMGNPYPLGSYLFPKYTPTSRVQHDPNGDPSLTWDQRTFCGTWPIFDQHSGGGYAISACLEQSTRVMFQGISNVDQKNLTCDLGHMFVTNSDGIPIGVVSGFTEWPGKTQKTALGCLDSSFGGAPSVLPLPYQTEQNYRNKDSSTAWQTDEITRGGVVLPKFSMDMNRTTLQAAEPFQ